MKNRLVQCCITNQRKDKMPHPSSPVEGNPKAPLSTPATFITAGVAPTPIQLNEQLVSSNTGTHFTDLKWTEKLSEFCKQKLRFPPCGAFFRSVLRKVFIIVLNVLERECPQLNQTKPLDKCDYKGFRKTRISIFHVFP